MFLFLLTHFSIIHSNQAARQHHRAYLKIRKAGTFVRCISFAFRLTTITMAAHPRIADTRPLNGERASIMLHSDHKHRIVKHYDFVSPYYRSLWGEHLHHGYWIHGNESKEQAQIQLIEHLARLANVQPGLRMLDIGCGFGATSLYFAKNHAAAVTGITISPVQVEMARQAAANARLNAEFLLMDAEAMDFAQPFDLLWSVESISHYQNLREFFASAAKLLKPGGTFALTDWFRKENLSPAERKKFIEPIDKGMMVKLHEMDEYDNFLTSSGLQIVHRQVLSPNCAKTWDIGVNIIKNKSFWALAAKTGTEFVSYLKAFRTVRAGFASGNFVYGLFVATAPSNSSAASSA
jgi:tocopherol O-methyltransferase